MFGEFVAKIAIEISTCARVPRTDLCMISYWLESPNPDDTEICLHVELGGAVRGWKSRCVNVSRCERCADDLTLTIFVAAYF